MTALIAHMIMITAPNLRRTLMLPVSCQHAKHEMVCKAPTCYMVLNEGEW